jgi:hypothetical protein
VRGDPRNLVGGQPVSEHDVPGGTEKGVVETGRLKRPRAVGTAPGYALRVTHSARTSTKYLINIFAQLDAHNSFLLETYTDCNLRVLICVSSFAVMNYRFGS